MVKIDRRRKSLLILECDSGKLEQQNLALGSELQNQVRAFFPKNPVSLIQSYNEADLLKSLGELFSTGQIYRTIIIIGHSNRNGLQISADRPFSWEAIANWIKPFEPQRVILLACEAGKWLPCAALFDGISSLDEIFGSPVLANKNQKYIVLGRTLHILGAKKEDPELNQLMKIGNTLLTKGIMFSRTRKEYELEGDEEGKLWTDLIEPFLEQLIERLR